MFEHLRETRYQEGCRDRDRGILPSQDDSVYLEGYLKGRPEGLDGIMQYFPTVEDFMKWKYTNSSNL
ncbi:hypothetical protein V2H45_02555 [Tumidithrix elongata RA019]|uniref:Uncharacterized protein n=1 Tax=Tumidithrix elongata BACA0141 TaxID=2716417 RepID=A0AAW9PYI1_9CYAN|nr:hypothetical protein [Tumidithrix elongata RA019]